MKNAEIIYTVTIPGEPGSHLSFSALGALRLCIWLLMRPADPHASLVLSTSLRCTACGGTGKVKGKPCRSCGGEGDRQISVEPMTRATLEEAAR